MDVIFPTALAENLEDEGGRAAVLPSGNAEGPTHDNSDGMLTTNFPSRAGYRSFNSAIHLARRLYHGQLFARRVIDPGRPAGCYLESG